MRFQDIKADLQIANNTSHAHRKIHNNTHESKLSPECKLWWKHTVGSAAEERRDIKYTYGVSVFHYQLVRKEGGLDGGFPHLSSHKSIDATS